MTQLSNKYNKFLYFFLFLSSFALGLFNELACVISGAVLAVMLLIKMFKSNELTIKLSISFFAVLSIVSGYLVTVLWGIDKYNSLLGFAKFLPILLFFFAIQDVENEDKGKLLSFIPYSAVIMTVISFAFTKLNILADYFSVSGRISGFFQYSNTFALFLLIGIIVTYSKSNAKAFDYIMLSVMIIGVFLTGSRTSFALLAIVIICGLFICENKKLGISALVVIVAGVIFAVIFASVTNKYGAFGRFLTTSINAGTLQGRLLYFKDALRVIIKHPFGLGYMGYYFSQGSFQTGVYSNQYVHNELLQLLLDIGFIPTLLFIAMLIKSLIGKSCSKMQKMIIVITIAHSMLDFDFQFLTIVFILLLCVDTSGSEKTFTIKSAVKYIITAVSVLIFSGSLIISISSFMYTIGNSKQSVKLCTYNTLAQLDVLEQENDINRKAEIANKVLKNNKYISNVYSAIAVYNYQNGDIDLMIENKKKAISCNKYYIDEYIDYCGVLFSLIEYYQESGDYDSVEYCCYEIIELNNTLSNVRNTTDKIAYNLTDKPSLELPEEYQEAIDEIVNMQ